MYYSMAFVDYQKAFDSDNTHAVICSLISKGNNFLRNFPENATAIPKVVRDIGAGKHRIISHKKLYGFSDPIYD